MGEEPITLVEYDPAWPARFQAERTALEGVLSPWLAGPIEHIGSTAVPGMIAKPDVRSLKSREDGQHHRVRAMAREGEQCMPITVRVADPRDLAFVGRDDYLEAAVVKRKIDQGEVIVAELDGVPVGYARIEYLWSLRPYLSLIHVVERQRRQGVGRAMLSFLEEMLRSNGHAILLSSSQADEPEPQAWHRRMGFRECGIITGVNDGGVGEVFFAKDL